MANNGGSSPRIMVFRPTMEEFQRFSEYIKKIEDQGAHKAGLAKIIPPENWCPRKGGYDDISMVIPSPISQVVTGRQGLYQQINIQQKSMTVKEFQKLAESNKYGTPTHFDYEDLERKYWKNITYNSPIYGADVSGSLYDDGIEEFNIQHLNTILDLVADDYGIQIDGVNTAYLYFGMWKTTFAWHTEDMDLYSINYLHFGAPKSWYAIPPEHGRRLERLAAGFFHGSFQSCPAFLRHKMTIISPQILKQYSIPYNKITQEPGEFMITFPFGYHSGFNHGFNCAESTNFAMPRWVEYGKRALSCSCRNDCVKICMDMFVRKFQPERYDLWKQGKDVGPHPEDPSRQYAAQPPNKAELAIAAQRERRRVKKEQTQNLKRHPISKIGKGDAKLQIHSNKDESESRFQGTEKSDSEETEIYDIEEILKKSKRKKRNSTDCPVEKTVQKPRKVSKKPVYDGRVRIKSESSFSSTSEEMEQNILDNPPDLKPFWDSEVIKPKMEIHDHSDLTVYGVSSSNKKTAFSDYPSLNKSSESLLSIAYHQQSYLPSGQLPIMQARNNDNGQIASVTLNNALENPCFSPASNFAHSYKRVVQTNNQGLTLKVKSTKFSDNESIVTEESDLSIPKWSCKQTEKGLKIKIVSPKGSSHELYPLAEHEITPCTSHSLKAEKLIHGSIDLNLTGNIQQARASASSVSVDHAYLSSANLMSLGQHVRRNKKTKKLKCDTSKESSVNWVSPVAGLLHHVPPNIEAERHFNKLCSAVKPHCAVCNIFTPLDNSNSILHEGMIIPSYSPVKMPAVCFSKGIDNLCSLDSNPLLNRDGSSPLVVCSHCYVCVHATCYGITILKLGPWLCARCASHAEIASCCLCVLRGGALKPTTDGRWVHVICAALVEEVHFENTVLKEPVNVSHVVRKRINLKCVYCFKSVVPKRNYSGCCIQCRSGKCSVPFHVTCGYMAGVHFESRDWPDPVVMTCTRHVRKKHVKRQFTNVEVGDKVLVKHKNRRYYWVTVKKKYHQLYYSALFTDNSTSTNLLPEDIIDENGVQREHLDIGEEVQVKWSDGKIYTSIFQGSRSCDVFVVEFEDGVVSDLERHQFFAADEAIPKEVLSRVCPKSEIQCSSNVHSSDQISNNPISSSSSS